MKLLLVIALAFGRLALADEATDRSDISKLVAALNDRNAPHDQLYTSDSGDSRNQIERIGDMRGQPMSEITQPFIVLNAIRFITPEVALVDATSAQYGSVYNRRVPVLFILRKTKDWQIAVARVQVTPVPFPGIGVNLVDLRSTR